MYTDKGEQDEMQSGTDSRIAQDALRQIDGDGTANAMKPEAAEQSTAQKVMDALQDDDEEHVCLSLGAVLGGDILTGKWFRNHLKFFVMIVVMIICYITNRYTFQQNMIKMDNLKEELSEKRNESMTRSSQLLQRTRESKIEEYLRNTSDSDLKLPAHPPYIIRTD